MVSIILFCLHCIYLVPYYNYLWWGSRAWFIGAEEVEYRTATVGSIPERKWPAIIKCSSWESQTWSWVGLILIISIILAANFSSLFSYENVLACANFYANIIFILFIHMHSSPCHLPQETFTWERGVASFLWWHELGL